MSYHPRPGFIVTSGARSQTIVSATTRISFNGVRHSFVTRHVTVHQALSNEIERAERCHSPVHHGMGFLEPDDDRHDRASNGRNAALRRIVERAVINELAVAAVSGVRRRRKNTYTNTRFHTTCPVPRSGFNPL